MAPSPDTADLDALRDAVCEANRALVAAGLVFQTWGNASGVDAARRVMVIKPSGVAYDDLRPDTMVAVDLDSGAALDAGLRPSSDTPTHLELYRALPGLGGIVHTHSLYATAWAQAGREIPLLGTTHADFLRGAVPCTRVLTDEEIAGDYEANTGRVILERLRGLNPAEVPAVLVTSHGPFTWGPDPRAAVQNAIVLERVAELALATLRVRPDAPSIGAALRDKHFFRKHGREARYGQDPPAHER